MAGKITGRPAKRAKIAPSEPNPTASTRSSRSKQPAQPAPAPPPPASEADTAAGAKDKVPKTDVKSDKSIAKEKTMKEKSASKEKAPKDAAPPPPAETSDGYKTSLVASRAPVMSKNRIEKWETQSNGRSWKSLLLREKEQFFDEHWTDEQKDKPGSLPWAMDHKPDDVTAAEWGEIMTNNADGQYLTRQERAEVFDAYYQKLKLPNPWYELGAGGNPLPDEGPKPTASMQTVLSDPRVKKDSTTKNQRHRLGAPTSSGPAKALTQAEINKNFERMLPNLIGYLPYFEKMTHSKVALIMETRAEHGARVGRGKRSANNDKLRYYAITGSTDSKSSSESLTARLDTFSNAWQGGKKLTDEEREDGAQDREDMILVPQPKLSSTAAASPPPSAPSEKPPAVPSSSTNKK